ncbi:accessory gene regulator B family protein [Macrococcoides canis]|uniref:accessory gene regulator B family protein n=1 Tax=Macrococcoides canis TaxID=1855823 RepID=UPI001AEC0D72|nr:accessory gene regulator B family protein [Macrococcus canis]QTQ07745.1 accessory gene regulator B family protein [Macrococcus canis]
MTTISYEKLQKKFNLSHLEILKMQRAVNILYKNISLVVIVYSMSFLLDVLIEAIIMHATYFCIRLTSFGAHFKHYFPCMLFSIVTFALIPKLVSLIHINFLLAALVACVTIIYYAPVATKKHPIHAHHRKKLKIQTCFTVTILLMISIFIHPDYAQLMYVGMITQSLTLLPLFNKE